MGRFYQHLWDVFYIYCRLDPNVAGDEHPKHNRYMLKKVLPGKGNRISLLLAGLALGFLMNMTCAGVAMLNGDIKLSLYDFSVIPFILMLAAVFIQSSAEAISIRKSRKNFQINGFRL